MSADTPRRVVCAANRYPCGAVILGPRHFDALMRQQIQLLSNLGHVLRHSNAEQGFVDQRGEFLTREEAHKLAAAAGQIIRRCGGDEETLYSENLY